MNDSDAIRVASINLLNGGIDPDGSTVRRDQSVAALRDWRPHLVLVQELYAPAEEMLRSHLWMLANGLDMTLAGLGLPRGSWRLRTAILADTRVLRVTDDGPGSYLDAPFWAQATVTVRQTGTMLDIYSVHAPATTAAGQLTEAQRLATRIVQRGRLAITGGDWNCYVPSDALTGHEIAALSPHLVPARIRQLPDGQRMANYDVHETLCATGLIDPVPLLSPDRKDPSEPPGTGSHPRARIDRFHLTQEVMAAVTCYHQKPNPGSDHQMLMICLDPAILARTCPPGPRP